MFCARLINFLTNDVHQESAFFFNNNITQAPEDWRRRRKEESYDGWRTKTAEIEEDRL